MIGRHRSICEASLARSASGVAWVDRQQVGFDAGELLGDSLVLHDLAKRLVQGGDDRLGGADRRIHAEPHADREARHAVLGRSRHVEKRGHALRRGQPIGAQVAAADHAGGRGRQVADRVNLASPLPSLTHPGSRHTGAHIAGLTCAALAFGDFTSCASLQRGTNNTPYRVSRGEVLCAHARQSWLALWLLS